MVYHVRPGLHFCEIGSRLVFLDVEADRYFCLEEGIEMVLRAALSGTDATLPTDPLIRDLLDRNVLVEGVPVPPRSRTLPAADRSLLDPPLPIASWATTARAVAALTASLARLRLCSLSANLKSADEMSRDTRALCDPDRLRSVAAAFHRAGSWVSSQDRCLGQSLAVARRARRAGANVAVVIGVSLGPFRAHCWVQIGTTVVNDRVETVSRYTPILVA